MIVRKWGPETQVNSTTIGFQSEPSVAALTNGGYVVAWADASGPFPRVLFQRFDAEGRPVGAEAAVPGPFSHFRFAPAVAALPDGGFAIAVERDILGDSDVIAVRFDAQGQAIGTDSHGLANPGQNLDPAATAVADGYLVVHELNGNIYASRNGAAGNPMFNSVKVNLAGGPARDPDIASTPFGASFVVWCDTNNGTLKGRLLGPSGGLTTNPVDVAFGLDGTFDPSVAALTSGGYVVAWMSDAGDFPGQDRNIRLRLISPTGTPSGDDLRVNVTTLGNQVAPEVVALRSGGFAAIWIDELAGAIRGQAFDGFGARIGTEFFVSSSGESTASTGEDLSVAELSDGRLIVTWTGTDENGTPGIVSQIVDPRGGLVTGTEGQDRLLGHDLVNDEITALGGNDSLLGLRGDDALYAGKGDDTLLGGRGDDLLFGGNGNDVLRGGAGGDELRGGWGVDRADYAGAAAAVTAALDRSLAGTGEAAGDSFASIENLGGTAFADRLRGDAVANVIYGGAGADTIEGQAGSDWLSGGSGVDRMTGGMGDDRFRFFALSEVGDIVTDFRNLSGNNDILHFVGSAFGGLAAGTLIASRFRTRADNVAQDADDRFIFRTTDRTLWFDSNGAGGAGPVLVADFDPGATVTSADILIV